MEVSIPRVFPLRSLRTPIPPARALRPLKNSMIIRRITVILTLLFMIFTNEVFRILTIQY